MSDPSIESFSWHDAVFRRIVSSATDDDMKSGDVEIFLDAYQTFASSSRLSVKIHCTEVARVNICLDFSELELNRTAGNINNLYVKDVQLAGCHDQQVLWVHLVDGMIEIMAKSVMAEAQ